MSATTFYDPLRGQHRPASQDNIRELRESVTALAETVSMLAAYLIGDSMQRERGAQGDPDTDREHLRDMQSAAYAVAERARVR